MSAYLLGNLLGRLVISILLVYVAIFVFKKFKFREALHCMRSPWSIMTVLLIFLLGLVGAVLAL